MYYEDAIKYIKSCNEDTQFIIFSDDINWCRRNVVIDDAVYVERKGGTAIDDLSLAAQCKNIIMANSTFSWWSAWLNRNPDKIVIGPTPAFDKLDIRDADLYPQSWVLIPKS